MRVQKKSSTKKIIATIVALVLLVLAVALAYSYMNRQDNKESNINSTSTKSEQIKKETEDRDASTKDKRDESVVHEPEKNITPPYSGENIDNSPSLSGSINYKSVVDGNLVIRTTINQVVSGGKCTLKLRNGSRVFARGSGIVQNPSSSTCEGFSVPVSELGSGNWQIEIFVFSEDRKVTLTDNVTI